MNIVAFDPLALPTRENGDAKNEYEGDDSSVEVEGVPFGLFGHGRAGFRTVNCC
jgi:hypothetical protein